MFTTPVIDDEVALDSESQLQPSLGLRRNQGCLGPLFLLVGCKFWVKSLKLSWQLDILETTKQQPKP